MPNVTFTGEGKSDPEQITFRGVTFPLGVPVACSEDVAAKLRANSHFQVSDDEYSAALDKFSTNQAETFNELAVLAAPKRKPGRPPKIK